MAVLATYGQFSTYTDANGRYRAIWQFPDGNIGMFKFESFKTEAELDAYFAQYLIEQEYGSIEQISAFLSEDELLIKSIVIYIRTRPTLTLTQWNNYLNTLPYENRAITKAFIHKLALGLSKHYGVVLANYTETEMSLHNILSEKRISGEWFMVSANDAVLMAKSMLCSFDIVRHNKPLMTLRLCKSRHFSPILEFDRLTGDLEWFDHRKTGVIFANYGSGVFSIFINRGIAEITAKSINMTYIEKFPSVLCAQMWAEEKSKTTKFIRNFNAQGYKS